MNKRLLAAAVGTAISALTPSAFAQPFSSFDPRSMGMGGAGVAVANTATAPFFNPALLSITDPSDDFAAELPVLGARAYDPKELMNSLDNFQKADLVDVLNTQITACSSTGNCTDAITTADQLAHDPTVGFPAISNKEVQGEFGAALVIGIPSKTWGAAFAADSWATFGGISHYTDSDQAALDALIKAATDCKNDPVVNAAQCNAVANFNPNDLTSSVHVQGVVLSSVGVSVSHEFEFFGTPVAFGATPKVVKATTFDYSARINDVSTSSVQGEDYIKEQTNFNMDVGLARDYDNGWRVGLVVKNVIPQEYDFRHRDPTTLLWVKDGTLKLNPQARAGLSYKNDWFTTALDADLTENNGVGFEDKTRYVSLGTELNAANWAQVRLGYRADTINNKRSVASAGLGFSPLGLHIDLAVAGNANEIGAAFQMGFRF